MPDQALYTWTIYCCAGQYTVARFRILPGVSEAEATGAACSLEYARALVPPGRVNLGRQGDDDEVIVETWI